MKFIFTGFHPTVNAKAAKDACISLLPWRWHRLHFGEDIGRIRAALESFFPGFSVMTFDSGRSSLYVALEALEVGKGDRVLVQAFTCAVVINAILKTGATPVYVDIDEFCNMDPKSLAERVTSSCKALIIQHTFGTPANVSSLLAIATSRGIRTIEDCAHALGAQIGHERVGTQADIGMFSFGSDKVISCSRGGALITRDHMLEKKIEAIYESLPPMRTLDVIRHLFNMPLFLISKKIYASGIGKGILWFARATHISGAIMTNREKNGYFEDPYPAKLANALARVVIPFIFRIDVINDHRKKIAHIYEESLLNARVIQSLALPTATSHSIYLRYPILVGTPSTIHASLLRHNIILGTWYDSPVAPADTNLQAMMYSWGQCPRAEYYCKHIVNLPTDPDIDEETARRIALLICDL